VYNNVFCEPTDKQYEKGLLPQPRYQPTQPNNHCINRNHHQYSSRRKK
jgi:hypothetical protein